MHNRIFKRLAAPVAVMLAACLLAGCVALHPVDGYGGATSGGQSGETTPWDGGTGRDKSGSGNSGGDSTAPGILPYPFGEDTPSAAGPEATPANIAYGSAKLLAGTTAVVSVYLDDAAGNTWSDAEITASRARLASAATWITGQCRQYGVAPTLLLDDGTDHSPLFCHTTYDGIFRGGVDADEGDAFCDAMDILCARLDSEALALAYGTDSVAFLLFLPVAGTSYTIVHYQDYGIEYYYEYSCLYREDAAEPGTPESAAVYAHELLHQFGAPDLYEGSGDAFVTPELTDYVAATWPEEIMYDTYPADGGPAAPGDNTIDKEMGEITAYRLGLTNTCAALDTFPAIADTVPGTFVGAATGETASPWSRTEDFIAA